MTTPLSALLLSDGRPGHFNLSEGILAAAQRLTPLEVMRLEVHRGRWPGRVLAAWSNSGIAPSRLLMTVHGIDGPALPKVDLVVSAGAETLAANVACARLTGAANIFYGSLRRFDAATFALALTSYAHQCRHPNQAFALKPSPAGELARAHRAAVPRQPPRTLALLIGGPSGETRFEAGDWECLRALLSASPAHEVRWLVTNSRRTPASVSDGLAELARARQASFALFADIRQPGAIPLAQVLAASDAAFVTDDSSSMVSDAIAAGLPVIGLAPRNHALTGNERSYRATLTQNGWYRSAAIDTDVEQLLAMFGALTPLAADPAEALAVLLGQRLPHVFAR